MGSSPCCTADNADSTVADLAVLWWLKCLISFPTCIRVQRFAADSRLTYGVDCRGIFPSPVAIQRATQKIPVPLQLGLETRRCNLIPHHSDSVVLPQSAFIGVGGNGIVLKQVLKGRKYAVKWVRFCNNQYLIPYEASY